MNRRLVLALAVGLMITIAAPRVEAQKKPGPKPPPQPAVTLTGLVVNSVTGSGNQLVANATATLLVAGQQVTQDVTIPLALTSSGDCSILNLSIGPVHLDLLGLIVDLNDCSGGPVTVTLTGTTGPGMLLGNLLCGIAGLLDTGTLTPAALTTPIAGTTTTAAGALTTLLNGILDELLASGTTTTGGGSADGITQILNLNIGPITLDLLGLHLVTSPICLTISAQEGPGNLLGNLLTSLTNLLNNPGNNLFAQQVLIRNILNVLSGLGL